MAEIRKEIEKQYDVTIMAASGKITAGQIIDVLIDYYEGEFTSNLIWDYTDADLTDIANADLQRISSASRRYTHLRKKGKTAIVVTEPLGFGLGRMYEIINEMEENPVRYNIFKTRQEALEWMRI
jgi:hypothetical protein